MAASGTTLRRGLPRVVGGDPWPPASAVAVLAAVGADESDPDVAATAALPRAQDADAAPGGPPNATVEPRTVLAARIARTQDAGAGAVALQEAPVEASAVTAGPVVGVRRGLPRVPGGEPWPPASVTVPASAASAPAALFRRAQDAGAPPSAPQNATVEAPGAVVARVRGTQGADAAPAESHNGAVEAVAAPGAGVRRGLPRVPGGEPWPPSSVVAPVPKAPVRRTQHADAATTASQDAPVEPAAAAPATGVRRGLPRVPGGEPRPAASIVAPTGAPAAAASAQRTRTAPAAPADSQNAPVEPAAASLADRPPLPFTRTVWPGGVARTRAEPAVARRAEPRRIGPYTPVQWAGATAIVGIGLLVLAAIGVVAVRFLLAAEPGRAFLAAFPGEYELPEGAPVGFPPWLSWAHFFNAFLIVLIIRSGLQVRSEKRPSVFWSPRGNDRRKISLTLWFHQSLDILWIVNGVAYTVLLFVTGQWVRIVPTSWEVFPNAVSAGLQYVSLDWPTENGWVNYNGLQQLAYFATVFIAAPLAIATGVRMSGVWPQKAQRLNRLYPVEWARKVHFPVMIYFVVFIIGHVALVFATGALRNLNHMYAGQDAVNFAGFGIFVLSLAVIAAGWVAARPLVLAPIARLFGTVKGR